MWDSKGVICRIGIAAGLLFTSRVALSQDRVNPYKRPVISPYLNLLNDNNGLAFNYFMRVQPQVQFQRQALRQAQGLQQLQDEVRRDEQLLQSTTSQLGGTGHAATFMNYGGYFKMPSGVGGSGGGLRTRGVGGSRPSPVSIGGGGMGMGGMGMMGMGGGMY